MKEDQQARLPDGRALGYGDYGDPEGEPVFFFHGWPSSRYQGWLLHEAAAERGLRVIAPDRPGIGLSDPLPGRGFAAFPRDIAGLADALEIGRFHLCGVSGGCPYTLATAAALPERVRAAAVICGAPPLRDKADKAHMHWAYRTMAGLKQLRRFAIPTVIGASRWMIARGAERAPMSWMLRSIPPADREAIAEHDCWGSVTRSYLVAADSGSQAMLTEGELYRALGFRAGGDPRANRLLARPGGQEPALRSRQAPGRPGSRRGRPLDRRRGPLFTSAPLPRPGARLAEGAVLTSSPQIGLEPRLPSGEFRPSTFSWTIGFIRF
ncbi:alpha/beta fold hydrolase [Luteolibacter sp. Populi]|uniref:alpha/beta fold hydrolase n=1 Tax=Luteolibacter sp. Populi TaxID=3230487 RepID=UPI003465D13E